VLDPFRTHARSLGRPGRFTNPNLVAAIHLPLGRGLQFILDIPAIFGRNASRSDCFTMDLGDILGPTSIQPTMQATDRWQAIDELIDLLVASGKIQPPHRDAIAAVVKKRENSMSTGIGFGIGIPHASTDLIPEVVAALGRSQTGINFDALDNQPVKLVMLFLVPQGQFQKHLHTLAGIAKILHKAEFRQAIEQAPDAAAMLQVIKDHGKK
jgi:mannitol/fructose-specific phosphotransferase system IIA component (Ntr-type)